MPAKYAKIGDKFFTVGEGSQLQQISEQDIIGRRGDIPTGIVGGKQAPDALTLIRQEGDIQDIDPSQLSFSPQGEVSLGGQRLSLGGSQAFVKPGTTVEQFGGLPFNQDFSQYLGQTGQRFDQQGFSGSATIPSTQATQFTPPQTTNANNQVYKQWNAQRNSWDVFNADGSPVDLATFQQKGYNIDHINTKQVLGSRTPGQQEADQTFIDGGTTTSRLPGEQNDRLKALEAKDAAITTAAASIASWEDKTPEITAKEKELSDAQASLELGFVDIEGKPVAMAAIIGQQLQLEKRGNVIINRLQRELDILKDDREAQYNKLVRTYDISRQSLTDSIALYKLTQPDKLGFDEKTGTVFFQNPMDNTVYQKQIPGFVPSEDPITLEKEYNTFVKKGYTGSFIEFAQWKAQQFGTETTGGGGGNEDIDSFAHRLNAGQITAGNIPQAIRGQVLTKAKGFATEDMSEDITIGDSQGMTREQLTEQLAPAYPEFSKQEIRDKVFELIPDKPQEKKPEEQGFLGGFFNNLFKF